MTTYIEQLNEYYKLKEKYESSKEKLKGSILYGDNKKKSWREKRLEYQQLKPKCINCKRPVGSIFTQKYDKEIGSRLLKAICGDRVNPCPLNIVINTGYYETYSGTIKEMENIIKKDKNGIIIDKNKLLFGYIKSEDAINNFEKLKTNISEYTGLLSFELNKYMEIVDNPDEKKELNIKTQEVFDLIATIKETMEKFDDTNDTQFVRDTVDLYVNSLTPKLNNLLHLKYKYCFVELHEYDYTRNLIQRKNTPEELEFPLVEPSIVQFTTGIASKVKTRKNKEKKTPLTKTKKNRQTDFEIVSDEEDNAAPQPPPVQPDIEIVSDEEELGEFIPLNVPEQNDNDNDSDNEFDNEFDERDYND
jgi:hypothetical protein